MVSASADQYARLTITQDGNTEISGSLDVGDNITTQGNLTARGDRINFINLPTSDPGVAGFLYRTGSDAIGASAGFQVICMSEG